METIKKETTKQESSQHKAAPKKAALSKLKKVLHEELYKCIRCGECRTICPVFREKFAERYTARGKMLIVDALAKGNLEFTEHAREALENCLLCTGCSSICSSGAKADRVILAARQAFAEELGLPTLKKIIGKTMTQSGAVLGAKARIGSIVQQLLFKKVPQDSGLYRRFALPKIDAKQYVPPIASPTFRQRVQKAPVSGDKTAIFFTGCMANYSMTEIADSVVKVLNGVGVSVDVPSAQSCCGMPMLTSGDTASVRKAAEHNIRALASSSAPIVVACGSCGHMLRHGYLEFLGDDEELAPMLKDISERTIEITQYLMQNIGEEKLATLIKPGTALGVTYHDPCHLRKAQNITKEPRAVLTLAARGPIREMESPETCCGLGGTFAISHMDLSKKIQKHKIEDALNTGADCIATACPGCVLQLRDGIRRSSQQKLQVKHVIQIFADAME